jgi:hypothetical protein
MIFTNFACPYKLSYFSKLIIAIHSPVPKNEGAHNSIAHIIYVQEIEGQKLISRNFAYSLGLFICQEKELDLHSTELFSFYELDTVQ